MHGSVAEAQSGASTAEPKVGLSGDQLLAQAAKGAVRSYQAAALHNAPAAEALADEAAAAVPVDLYSSPWLGLSPGSWSQVVASLQLDLVCVKGKHKELLGGWAGDKGEAMVMFIL